MNLHLYNGRHHPDEELDDWGFEGPTLRNIKAVQWTYGELKVYFDREWDQQVARALTNWTTHGPTALAILTDEYIETKDGFFGDFNITYD